MKIKIIKTYTENAWYNNDIGNIFKVAKQPTELNGHCFYLIIERGEMTRKAINTEDVEILDYSL